MAFVLALVGAMTLIVSGALADASNPISGTIKATAVDNHDGTVTVYVRGQYNWLTHGDCNTDRAGSGVGLIWSDPTETGYTVSKGAISEDLGVKTKNVGGQWSTDPNPLD
jgi:DNA/RNA endonuclease YhcR with UshA esterase domain